ncbi:acyl-CoA synthetase [Natrinema caseinilyticum]|uniref:acyl-CoA synthetase n=1 Tax=Natrinema caseinilyticum TaxID=2961570 RepID=UPI0020C5A796|nr:AMP-binding protein [Natrinema caseinilyticum]
MDIDLSEYDGYDEAYEQFEWDIPDTFNIAEAVCGRWAGRDDGKHRVAFFYEAEDGSRETYTFWQVQRIANRVSNLLSDVGVERGTRVGVVLPQRPETLFANLGVLQLGGISVPLSVLYGTEGLRYRLDHSQTEVAIVDAERANVVADLREELDHLETIITLDDPVGVDGRSWEQGVAAAATDFQTVETDAEDSAYIIYTSGTTGKPKGAHHAHRKLLGYIPGWQLINEFPGDGSVHYTASGWSWVGGLFAVVWGAWYHGQPVVGYGGQFEPETVYGLLERYGITNPLLTSTMIRMMKDVDHSQYDLDVEVVPSGGEKVTTDIFEFVEDEWDAVVNEIYGQTECNFLVGTNHELMDENRDATGKPCPGHTVAIIDEQTGDRKDPGEIGHIAVKRPDPSMLLDYWNQPDLTADLFVGDWMKTGDAGSVDSDGYIYYEGRADDVIITSGYRVSPLELEECLREHGSVNDSVIAGIDDEERGTIVKAFIKPEDAVDPSDDLVSELQKFVKDREAAYKYPREVEFVDEFPTTVSGKVQRHKLVE